MIKSIACGVAAVVLCCAGAARAASITVTPGALLSASPGETIGWGYDITADIDWDLEFIASFIDLPLGSGDMFDLFDFPLIPAGTSLRVDYDHAVPAGLLELAVSPLLSPGDSVTGRVFLDYLRVDPLGLRPDESGVFELEIRALVTSAVPEPGPLLLVSVTLAALLGHRWFSAPRS